MKCSTWPIPLFCLFLLSAFWSCQQKKEAVLPANDAGSEAEISEIALDLPDLEATGNIPPVQHVNIKFDHFYKTAKTYEAYSLTALLKPYLDRMDLGPDSDAVLTFICTDGYKPTLKLSDALAHEGFITVKDMDVTAAGEKWQDSVKARFTPYYLAWKDIPYDNRLLAWPYGLIEIQINRYDTLFDAIFPTDRPELAAGFEHYRNYCNKCHSVNKVGGNLGPEFNYPKSILEYWEVENIWAFAKNPSSFRYNSKMQAVEALSRQEFDEIIRYLDYMKGRKPQEM